MEPEADAHHRGSVSVVDVGGYSSSSGGGSVSDSDDEKHCVSRRRKMPRVELPKGFLAPLPPDSRNPPQLLSERCKPEAAAPNSEPCGGDCFVLDSETVRRSMREVALIKADTVTLEERTVSTPPMATALTGRQVRACFRASSRHSDLEPLNLPDLMPGKKNPGCQGRPQHPPDLRGVYHAPFPIRDKEEGDRFSVLSKSKVVVARYFDCPALEGTAVLNQINGWIDRLGWHTFVRECEPTHRTLTIEFYTTFKFCDGSRRSFRYRSNGQNREVTYELLGEILGCQANGLTRPPATFSCDDYWHHLTGQDKFNVRNAPVGLIRNVALLIFHKFICHTISGKTESSRVSALELWLLWCVENNVKVSLIHLLVERMGAIPTSSRPTLGLGHIITKLAKHLGDFLHEGDEDNIIPFKILGMPILKGSIITPNSSKNTLRPDQRCDKRLEIDRSPCAGPAAEPHAETPGSEEPGTSSTAPTSLDIILQRIDCIEELMRSGRRESRRQAKMLASICDHHGIPYDPPSPSESSPVHEQ